MTPESRYRTNDLAKSVVAFSAAYQEDNLLARGLGLEHLKELLERLTRTILRKGGNIAYGGYWKKEPQNFTYHLLEIVKAEQEDGSRGGTQQGKPIGKLYNYAAWPYDLEINPTIEANVISTCRIVRFTQKDAGFQPDEIVAVLGTDKTGRELFNKAVTLSAMRCKMMKGITITLPDLPPEEIPPVTARILLGGKEKGYSGFLPGIVEEALTTFEKGCPVYLLGGFGGATQVLADAILNPGAGWPKELTAKWQVDQSADLGQLQRLSRRFRRPAGIRSMDELLEAVRDFVDKARHNPAEALKTGLDDPETRLLMQTHDIATVVRLVIKGLLAKQGVKAPPSPAGGG